MNWRSRKDVMCTDICHCVFFWFCELLFSFLTEDESRPPECRHEGTPKDTSPNKLQEVVWRENDTQIPY